MRMAAQAGFFLKEAAGFSLHNRFIAMHLAAHSIPPGGRLAAGTAGAAFNSQRAGCFSDFCLSLAYAGCGHRIIFLSFMQQGAQKDSAFGNSHKEKARISSIEISLSQENL
ncbi:MAG: hypothetical protein LBU32_26595 [Clostridiales bacterium]|jgi:hypothetical protein|nr:hypothetical protein [Clostridiales bacterium]